MANNILYVVEVAKNLQGRKAWRDTGTHCTTPQDALALRNLYRARTQDNCNPNTGAKYKLNQAYVRHWRYRVAVFGHLRVLA
jgi:hypothetical protein